MEHILHNTIQVKVFWVVTLCSDGSRIPTFQRI